MDERFVAMQLLDKNDPTLLTSKEIIESYGSCLNFMFSFGLKPYNPEDIEEAISISRSFKTGIDQDEVQNYNHDNLNEEIEKASIKLKRERELTKSSESKENEENLGKCGVCQSPCKNKCSNCKNIYYCCKEHQKSDYKIHKKICKLNIEKETIIIPTDKRFLLIGGAMFDINTDFFISGFSKHLNERNINFDVVEMKKSKIINALKTNKYTCCIGIQIGSGGSDVSFDEADIKNYFTEWVKKGGNLILHGERKLSKIFNDWFQLSWSFEGDFYRRTDHEICHHNPIYNELINKFNKNYNVKACMISNVLNSDRVYSMISGAKAYSAIPLPEFMGKSLTTGNSEPMSSISYTCYKQGKIGFFGDVNAENSTIETVTLLGLI